MSLYNSLFGTNNFSPILLTFLSLSENDFGRFRDCYLNEDKTKIVVYTRCGGGNREDYEEVFSEMETHPNYITNYDDDFDSTYAYFEFTIPEQFKETLKVFEGQKESPGEKFRQLIEDLESGNKNEQVDKALEVGEKIFGEIKTAFDSGENKIVTI